MAGEYFKFFHVDPLFSVSFLLNSFGMVGNRQVSTCRCGKSGNSVEFLGCGAALAVRGLHCEGADGDRT